MIGKVVTIFNLTVSSLGTTFFFSGSVSLADGMGLAEDEEDDEKVASEVSRGGTFSVEGSD